MRKIIAPTNQSTVYAGKDPSQQTSNPTQEWPRNKAEAWSVGLLVAELTADKVGTV